MTINMRELITKYQTNDDETVINKILNYADEDLLKYKYEDDNFNADVDGLIYIAYKIRAFLLNICFKERQARQFVEWSSEEKEDYEGLMGVEDSWISDFADNPFLGVDVDEFKEFNFESVYINEDKIMKCYGERGRDLLHLIDKFNYLRQDSDKFREDFEAIKEKLLPLFIEALKHGLSHVDAKRNNKEIVKYVNMAMMTKFIDLQIKSTGVKRIRRDGESKYIKPNFDNVDAWILMFGKTLKHVGADAFNAYLTKSQIDFMSKVYNVVDEKIDAKEVEFFHFNVDAKPILNKRKLAYEMGMKESNFKKTLQRIENNIYRNWSKVWGEYRKVI